MHLPSSFKGDAWECLCEEFEAMTVGKLFLTVILYGMQPSNRVRDTGDNGRVVNHSG